MLKNENEKRKDEPSINRDELQLTRIIQMPGLFAAFHLL